MKKKLSVIVIIVLLINCRLNYACIGLNGRNFPECYLSHSCTDAHIAKSLKIQQRGKNDDEWQFAQETRTQSSFISAVLYFQIKLHDRFVIISNESIAFLECCYERRLPEVCLRKCSYANYNQNTLRGMFSKTDPCPLSSANDIHFCAAQGHDHRQCCTMNGVNTTLAGQKCLIFCDQRMINDTTLDGSYLPCLERFETIRECFWHWARKRYQLMELSKKSQINESRMSTDYINQFSTKKPPVPFDNYQ